MTWAAKDRRDPGGFRLPRLDRGPQGLVPNSCKAVNLGYNAITILFESASCRLTGSRVLAEGAPRQHAIGSGDFSFSCIHSL